MTPMDLFAYLVAAGMGCGVAVFFLAVGLDMARRWLVRFTSHK